MTGNNYDYVHIHLVDQDEPERFEDVLWFATHPRTIMVRVPHPSGLGTFEHYYPLERVERIVAKTREPGDE